MITTAPLEEVKIYRDIVRQALAQTSILRQSDGAFIFLEQHYMTHLQQIDIAINVRETTDETISIQHALIL